MLKEYTESFRGHPINKNNVEIYTKHDFKHWVDIIGVQRDFMPDGFVTNEEIKLTGTYPALRIEVDTPKIFLDLRFDLEFKEIYVAWFILEERSTGRGTVLVDNFLNVASKMGFLYVGCRARTGTLESEQHYNQIVQVNKRIRLHGSMSWGKMGFTMDKRSHVQFLRLMQSNDMEETCLQQLLLKDNGVKFWKEKITDWKGEYYLASNSRNWLLHNFLKSLLKTI